MTAALELGPELQAAIDAAVKATVLALVPAGAERPLSMLAASIRRRECERRQADAARGDRSGDRSQELSTIPATVRKREAKRRKAAAQKARSIPDRSPPLDLQPVRTERTTAGGVLRTDRMPPGEHGAAPPVRSGPLAGDVAALVDRASGYAESTRKRDRVWLYEETRRTWNEDLGLHLPSQWTGPKDWGACRALVRGWDRDVLLKAVLDGGRAWKQAPGNWSRPTLGLVLHRLRLGPAAAAPTPKRDSRRSTGEQLEERDRERARPDLPHQVVMATSPAPAGPLRLAEPSPASSAEARDALELVNATAVRCRAFRNGDPP